MWRLAILCCAGCLCGGAFAAETDQYLSWGVELRDSAGVINDRLNQELGDLLDNANQPGRDPITAKQLTRRFYLRLFKGLYASRMRRWLRHADAIDRFPDASVSHDEYLRMSIYRKPYFPYILPMSPTIRIGDVYCSIDKLSHFFGFGRRYYNHYMRLRDAGLDDTEAMTKVVIRGIVSENGMVGKLVDGIFSHGDLEADYQGACMARDLCGGKEPHLEVKDGRWVMLRPIDIRDYVTPGFDESYNPSHFGALRKADVMPLLKAEYASRISEPSVRERFARYKRYAPSLSQRLIRAYLEARGDNPQRTQFLEAFGEPPGWFASLETAAPAQSHVEPPFARRTSEKRD